MNVSALDRANFFSQAFNAAGSFRLGSAADVQTFLEREARIFAAAHGYQASDTVELVRDIPNAWLERPDEIRDRFRLLALDSLAQHFGHASPKQNALTGVLGRLGHHGPSSFKQMVKAISRGTSAALDESGWFKTDGMGTSLLEICYSRADYVIYQRLHFGLGPVGASTDRTAESIAERIRAEDGLSIAVQGGERSELEVDLPDRGGELNRTATMKPGSPDEVTLRYATGNPFAQNTHAVHYVRSGERWVPTSGPNGAVEPGTFEHRVFEALAARAR